MAFQKELSSFIRECRRSINNNNYTDEEIEGGEQNTGVNKMVDKVQVPAEVKIQVQTGPTEASGQGPRRVKGQTEDCEQVQVRTQAKKGLLQSKGNGEEDSRKEMRDKDRISMTMMMANRTAEDNNNKNPLAREMGTVVKLSTPGILNRMNINDDSIINTNKRVGKSYEMKFYCNNIRGLQSKIDPFKNILCKERIDIAIVTETHNQGLKNIKVEDYVCYFRNRPIREKGGIAIYVHQKWANSTMKLEEGLEHNEFFVSRIESTTPNIIIIVFYGVIEGQFTKEEVRAMQGDLFEIIKKYNEEGCSLLWAGDFNNHVGNLWGLKDNPSEISPGGRSLAEFVDEEGLTLLNTRDMAHTHFDRTAGTSRILDLVFTNEPERIEGFEVDSKLDYTPYRLRRTKDGVRKMFTDHMGIKWTFKVDPCSNKTNKIIQWNYDKKDGGFKYEDKTNSLADYITCKLMECNDVDEIAEFILEKVDEAKTYAYGKITKTKSQLRVINDALIWRKRTKEVEREIASVEASKVRCNDRLWEMRNRLSDKFSDKQFVGVLNPETGKMSKTREETLDVTLKYNFELLRKDREEDRAKLSKEEAELIEAKEEMVRIAMNQKEFVEDEELCKEDFERVIQKIKLNNKNVYRDFMLAGEKFKNAVFHFFNMCYKQEKMPESFYETELLKLYKGKGVRAELKANRFIHLKGWMAKTYEKMLMTKMEAKMFSATPEFQVGGQKMGSTNEHLLSMIIAMRKLEKTQRTGAIIFMDIKACFDRVRLNDILFETVQAGVVGRPLKNIANYTDNLVIKMVGDNDQQRRERINNSTGQGSGFAPVGTSLVMAKTLEMKIKARKPEERAVIIKSVGGITLHHNFFVDDLSKNCSSREELRINGEIITEALNELQLQAHADKSGVLVYGKKREEFKQVIEQNPPRVQDFKLGFKEKETYLGMIFSSLGAEDSISQTIQNRRVRCLTKAATIKRTLADERMSKFGWLAGARLLHNSVVMSTLTYGAAAFTGMTKKQLDEVESIQRHCLLHILGISTKTTYLSLLFIMGILPAKDLIKKLQISFINNLLHIKEKGQCFETVKAELNNEAEGGILREVRQYCEEYGINDVTQYYVNPKEIRERVETRAFNRLWIKCIEAKKPPLAARREDGRGRHYSELPVNKAKLMLCFEVGDLNFRKNRKQESLKKYGSYECLVPFCREDDCFDHVRKCRGYTASLTKDDPEPMEIIEYLTELEEERVKRFKRSLINFKSL